MNMGSCNTRLIKFILHGFNIIFAISGLCILIIGAIVLLNFGEFRHFMTANALAPPIVLIITGLIIFLIALLGYWGTYKESTTLLFMYAILLGVIFIIELAVGVAACFFKSDLDTIITESLENSMRRSHPDDIMAWDYMQQKLLCCGIDDPSDWRRLSLNRTLPASCCRPQFIIKSTSHCINSPALGRDKYYQDGCLMKLKQLVDKNILTIIEIGLGIAFIQLLGIILALYLAILIHQQTANVAN